MNPDITPEQAAALYRWAKKVITRMNTKATEDWGGEVNEIQPTIDRIERPEEFVESTGEE